MDTRIILRIDTDLLKRIDEYAEKTAKPGKRPNRSKAIRCILDSKLSTDDYSESLSSINFVNRWIGDNTMDWRQ